MVNFSLERLLPIVLISMCLSQLIYAQSRSLLVITDMEPDDYILLILLAAEFPEEIVAVGTTGLHTGRQFTPADPNVVVGMAMADFITKVRQVDITIDLNDLDPYKGYKVMMKDDPASNIRMVESVDPEIFRQQVLSDLKKVTATAPKTNCRQTASAN